MRTGLENLVRSGFKGLQGKRIGLLVNQASVDKKLNHAIDLFRKQKTCRLVKIFGAQHGLYGQTQDNMIEWEGQPDPATGLEIISLYGENRKPTAAMLDGLDALLFDLPDIGARYYTFIYSMSYCMQSCGANGVEFWVLDRPNPIGGRQTEGNIVDPRFTSFVGLHPLAVRHGMSIGELAGMFKGAFAVDCVLKVVRMTGWKREMWFDQTGLPWINPSPNMPTSETATVYPGMCLLEGTNISEGRGTTMPFLQFGAPFVKPEVLKRELDRQKLPGVVFRPLYFMPTSNKYADQGCGGLFIHVVKRNLFKPFLTGIAILRALKKLYPKFAWKQPPYEYEYEKLPIDILLGGSKMREMIENQTPLTQIERSYSDALLSFRNLRRKYLLYK